MGLEVKCILLFMTLIRSTRNVSLFRAPTYNSTQERGLLPKTGTAMLRNCALDLFRWLHLFSPLYTVSSAQLHLSKSSLSLTFLSFICPVFSWRPALTSFYRSLKGRTTLKFRLSTYHHIDKAFHQLAGKISDNC